MTQPNIQKKTFDLNAHATCACGAEFTIGSIYSTITVDVCSQCHPFYTGNVKYLDTEHRVERFMEKVAAGKAHTEKSKKLNSSAKVNKKEKDA